MSTFHMFFQHFQQHTEASSSEKNAHAAGLHLSQNLSDLQRVMDIFGFVQNV